MKYLSRLGAPIVRTVVLSVCLASLSCNCCEGGNVGSQVTPPGPGTYNITCYETMNTVHYDETGQADGVESSVVSVLHRVTFASSEPECIADCEETPSQIFKVQ